MNNLISLFMNYKIQRLVEYGVFLLDEDSEFIRKVLHEYFSVYVDNYYYGIFYTIDDTVYSDEHLQQEFKGIMEEMLQDYLQYELVESNQEYHSHIDTIRSLKDFSLEVVKIDSLVIHSKNEVTSVVTDFVAKNTFYRDKLDNRLPKFIKLVRDTFQTVNKLLHYEDHYYTILHQSFLNHTDVHYLTLDYHINILHNYRKSMVSRVYSEEGLEEKKLECIIQKVSLYILRNIVEKKELPVFIIEFSDNFIKRGKIEDDVFSLIDNPLFRHYVYLGVSYNHYLEQKSAFSEDFHFACIQDFSHINDVFQKIQDVEQEGIFDYLVVSDYKYKDKDYFTGYEGDSMKVLVFEEE